LIRAWRNNLALPCCFLLAAIGGAVIDSDIGGKVGAVSVSIWRKGMELFVNLQNVSYPIQFV